jgi:hypothetical protein
MPSQPATVPQEQDNPEGATRATSPQERNAPEGVTRATYSEIQEVMENLSTALPRGIESGDAQVLELARTLWAAAFRVGDDTEEDEEVPTCNTLERVLMLVRRAFDELILPATSVSFPYTSNWFPDFPVLPRGTAHLRLVRGRPSRRQVRGEHVR